MDDLQVRDTDLLLDQYLGLLRLDCEGCARVRTTREHAARIRALQVPGKRELRLRVFGEPPRKAKAVFRIEGALATGSDEVVLTVRLLRYQWVGEDAWRSGRACSPQRLAAPGAILPRALPHLRQRPAGWL